MPHDFGVASIGMAKHPVNPAFARSGRRRAWTIHEPAAREPDLPADRRVAASLSPVPGP